MGSDPGIRNWVNQTAKLPSVPSVYLVEVHSARADCASRISNLVTLLAQSCELGGIAKSHEKCWTRLLIRSVAELADAFHTRILRKPQRRNFQPGDLPKYYLSAYKIFKFLYICSIYSSRLYISYLRFFPGRFRRIIFNIEFYTYI